MYISIIVLQKQHPVLPKVGLKHFFFTLEVWWHKLISNSDESWARKIWKLPWQKTTTSTTVTIQIHFVSVFILKKLILLLNKCTLIHNLVKIGLRMNKMIRDFKTYLQAVRSCWRLVIHSMVSTLLKSRESWIKIKLKSSVANSNTHKDPKKV